MKYTAEEARKLCVEINKKDAIRQIEKASEVGKFSETLILYNKTEVDEIIDTLLKAGFSTRVVDEGSYFHLKVSWL